MNKTSTVPLMLAAFIVGAVVASLGVSHYYNGMTRDILVGSSAVETGDTVATLTRYRMGKEINVVELLEKHLDSSEFMRLDRLLAENPASIRDRGVWVMLKSARDYRAKFPHEARSPQIDKATARVFSLLDERN
jgi:hypothetical protein